MKYVKKTLPILLSLALGLSLVACGEGGGDPAVTENSPPAMSVAPVGSVFTPEELAPTYTEDGATVITLSGNTALSSTNAARVTGSTVTITDEGTYILRGAWEGSIRLAAGTDDDVILVLDGATVTAGTASAIEIVTADTCTLLLADGTENALTSASTEGALTTALDLLLGGEGTLTVTATAGDGIKGKDALTVTGGTVTVTATGHAMDANDGIRLTGAALTLTAGMDGIHTENLEKPEKASLYIGDGSYTVTAEGDALSAGGTLTVAGGHLTLKTGQDAESAKGIKAGGSLAIGGGEITVTATDDAIHTNASLSVGGGTLTLATGDDGLHADVSLAIMGGEITVTESYEGLEAQHITVSGGRTTVTARDDGLNAAGGTDESGTAGIRPGGDQFGPHGGGMPPGQAAGNGSITISGGVLVILASGDGIDANGTLTITGGSVTVSGPTRGDTAVLDYDRVGTITGGTFIGTGSTMMAQTLTSGAEQGVLALSVGNRTAGTLITVKDARGEVILTYEPPLDYAIVIVSSPEMKKGESYTVTVGAQSGTFAAS